MTSVEIVLSKADFKFIQAVVQQRGVCRAIKFLGRSILAAREERNGCDSSPFVVEVSIDTTKETVDGISEVPENPKVQA